MICGARVTEGGVNSFDWKSQVLGGKTHWMNVKPGRIKGLNNTNGLFSSKTLCTVLSCHIGHGMTRTNQKCNKHLQSMSHVTWMNLNAFTFEALRIKTECLAVQFRVQLLHILLWLEGHKGG